VGTKKIFRRRIVISEEQQKNTDQEYRDPDEARFALFYHVTS
jgi:hypothetical protein